MSSSEIVRNRLWALAAVGASLLLSHVSLLPAAAGDSTSLHVIVTDAATGQPINQARLTLEFQAAGGRMRFGKPKKLSYSAKTNSQGKYKFVDIPKGPLMLVVTADKHQSYGKKIDLKQDNQVVEVKLKQPQPLQ